MRSMDFGRYRHNYKDFCENFMYLMPRIGGEQP